MSHILRFLRLLLTPFQRILSSLVGKYSEDYPIELSSLDIQIDLSPRVGKEEGARLEVRIYADVHNKMSSTVSWRDVEVTFTKEEDEQEIETLLRPARHYRGRLDSTQDINTEGSMGNLDLSPRNQKMTFGGEYAFQEGEFRRFLESSKLYIKWETVSHGIWGYLISCIPGDKRWRILVAIRTDNPAESDPIQASGDWEVKE